MATVPGGETGQRRKRKHAGHPPSARTPTRKITAAHRRLEGLYATLRDRICLLDYAPGQRLDESRLSREFGISRTPIRRVLTRLESEGLIEVYHGAGTYVTKLDPELLREIYELRKRLAPLFAELDPIRPSPETIARLKTLHRQIADLKEMPDLRRFAVLSNAYYLELTQLIGNRPLREIAQRLFFQTSRMWLLELPNLNWSEVIQSVGDEIGAVIAALEAGDLQEVGRVSRANISKTMQRLLGRALSSRLSGKRAENATDRRQARHRDLT